MRAKSLALVLILVTVVLVVAVFVNDMHGFLAGEVDRTAGLPNASSSSPPGSTLVATLRAFSDSILCLLSIALAFGSGYFFLYRAKFQEYHDAYFTKCAAYDQFLQALRGLRSSEVDRLMAEYVGAIEAPELMLFDSRFLQFVEVLAPLPKGERLRLLNNIRTQARPTRLYKGDVACSTPGCDDRFALSMYKGQHYSVECRACSRRYKAYVSRNDKLVIKPVPRTEKRLTLAYFDEQLPEYLIRLKASVPPSTLMLIIKTIVRIVNANPQITYGGLKKALSDDKALRDQLDDVDDAAEVLTKLLVSKVFFRACTGGIFPGYNAPLQLQTTEKLAYTAYITHLAYKLKEDRQLVVDDSVVKKLIAHVLPAGTFTETEEHNLITQVLEEIRSVAQLRPATP